MESFKAFCERFRVDPETRRAPLLHRPGGRRTGGGRHGDRRRLGGRARVHADGRPGHLADERVHRPGLLRRDPRGLLRRAAHGAVHGNADAHAAGATCCRSAYPSHGDTKHIAALPGQPGRVLLHGARRVRPRRALPDAGVRGVRPRHRDERLDVPAAHWDDGYTPDRGKVLSADDLEKIEKFYRYVDDNGDGIAARTLPGVHPKGGVLHPRVGAQPARRLHRGLRRVSGGRRPPGAEARGGGGGGAGAGDPARRRRRARRDHHRRLPRRGARGVRPAARAGASPSTTCASAASRSARRWWTSCDAHERCFVVEQNRDGQLRSLLALETGPAGASGCSRCASTAACR